VATVGQVVSVASGEVLVARGELPGVREKWRVARENLQPYKT